MELQSAAMMTTKLVLKLIQQIIATGLLVGRRHLTCAREKFDTSIIRVAFDPHELILSIVIQI
jgi:hypothetical protein